MTETKETRKTPWVVRAAQLIRLLAFAIIAYAMVIITVFQFIPEINLMVLTASKMDAATGLNLLSLLFVFLPAMLLDVIIVGGEVMIFKWLIKMTKKGLDSWTKAYEAVYPHKFKRIERSKKA